MAPIKKKKLKVSEIYSVEKNLRILNVENFVIIADQQYSITSNDYPTQKKCRLCLLSIHIEYDINYFLSSVENDQNYSTGRVDCNTH